jgi:hypothetical protein
MEDIDAACRAFTKSVDEYINRAIVRRRKRQRQKQHDISDNDDDDEEIINLRRSECNLLVEHANLVLYTLSAKRNSLSNAIQAFRAELTNYIERFAFYSSDDSNTVVKNSNNDGAAAAMQQQVEVVRRWFANYVRLRDGFVLLESGERRHDHDDSNISSSTSFPSKLKGALRPDGITRKFKSDKGYTGRGYDEVYDDDVGIKHRLLQTLAKLDSGRRSITTIDEKLFDDETGGATQWQMCMDEHISQSKLLRDELNCIAHDFVAGINRHLLLLNSNKTSSSSSSKKTTTVQKLTLNADDKFERIKLGDLIDISRRGNDFSIKDKGGSLPIGMSVNDWRAKFSVMKVLPTNSADVDTNKQSQKNKIENSRTMKKRKVILEDSSEDSDDDNNVMVSVPSTSKVEIDSKTQDDGLMVRKRMATDVSSDNHQCTKQHVNDGNGDDHITTSIDEMKRQLGVNTVELQRGHDQLEDEQLISSMAANEEDMLNGVLLQERGGDMVNNKSYTDSSNYSVLVPLLKQCYLTRNEVRKNMHNIEQLREMQDICSDFDDSAKRWNDHLQTLIELRSKEIAKGLLTETSDRVSVPFSSV